MLDNCDFAVSMTHISFWLSMSIPKTQKDISTEHASYSDTSFLKVSFWVLSVLPFDSDKNCVKLNKKT